MEQIRNGREKTLNEMGEMSQDWKKWKLSIQEDKQIYRSDVFIRLKRF